MSNEHPPSNSQEASPSDRVPRTSDRPQPWIRRQRSRVILLLLVLGLIVYEAPREISRWYLAAARVAIDREDAAAAGRYFDAAIAWDKNILKVKHDFVMDLNNLAYIRALAVLDGVLDPKELDAAWNDIEKAFEILDLEQPDAVPYDGLEALLDTRGYIAYLKGDLESACMDMEAAVAEAEKAYQRMIQQAERGLDVGIAQEEIELRKNQAEQYLAVIYHHRGEVYEALGHEDKAAQDFKHADELGYDPERGLR